MAIGSVSRSLNYDGKSSGRRGEKPKHILGGGYEASIGANDLNDLTATSILACVPLAPIEFQSRARCVPISRTPLEEEENEHADLADIEAIPNIKPAGKKGK